MPTTILLIRHGQTDWNLAGRWQGHADIPLNETGRDQAQALAARLADWPITAVYTSDLKRAAMTADILARRLGLTAVRDPAWRERDVGDFSGLTTPEARSQFAHIWADTDYGFINPPNGEHYRDLRTRSVAAFDAAVKRHMGETTAVVSHGGVLYNIISHVLGFGDEVYGRFRISGNTGLNVVEVNEGVPRLVLLNDTAHLE